MTILCRPEESTLLIVDAQARLMPAIHEGESVVRRCVQLATAAHELGIHVIGTEENPDGLGPLVDEIATLCDTILAKFHFSAVSEEGFLRRLPAGRDTIVIAGCEAHVCVLQTAIGLLESGRAVKWVADAVGSHTLVNALAQTRYGGVVAACGLAQGFDLPGTVMPFILRGVTLAGIDSVMAPLELRRLAWARLASDLDLQALDLITSEVPLEAAIEKAGALLAGGVRGRVVVRI